jgi:hypothetical protein
MAITELMNPEDTLVRNAMGTTKKLALGTVAGPASYAGGGFACDPATDFAITGTIDAVIAVPVYGAYGCKWDSAAKKVICYKALATEADNATDYSGCTFLIIIVYHD